jgi:biopolymer transport protein ExbD/biopolymer transport protein TolR
VLPRAEINVTPMIDVMLVLLIIFMIVTPIISSPVALPRSDHSDARPQKPGEITLTIDRSGVYFLSTTGSVVPSESAPRVIAANALRHQLEALYTHRTQDRILYLKADNRLGFGPVQEAIEIARRSGVRVVAAVTEQRSRRVARVPGPR